MIATARAAAPAARGSRTSALGSAIALLFACCSASPAAAQIGATASIFSDARFRGYSLSEGRPVASLDFSYDDPSGAYFGSSATGVLRRGGDPALLDVQADAGYAKQLRSGTTLDFGVTHSSYLNYSHRDRGKSYTEVYAGISRGILSSRISFSPRYFEADRWTTYAEVNANVSPARKWTLTAHAGALLTLHSAPPESYDPDFDWSLAVTRELGRLSLHAVWSAGAPGHDRYRGTAHSRSSALLGASWAL